jgi:hypothetical protein
MLLEDLLPAGVDMDSDPEDEEGGALAAARRARLGLDGSEKDVVRDAVTLAWVRRRSLRMVVVLVPDAAAVEGVNDNGGGGGRGEVQSSGGSAGVAGGHAVMSREHEQAALSIVAEVQRHGSIVAGTITDVLELLRQIVGEDL